SPASRALIPWRTVSLEAVAAPSSDDPSSSTGSGDFASCCEPPQALRARKPTPHASATRPDHEAPPARRPGERMATPGAAPPMDAPSPFLLPALLLDMLIVFSARGRCARPMGPSQIGRASCRERDPSVVLTDVVTAR